MLKIEVVFVDGKKFNYTITDKDKLILDKIGITIEGEPEDDLRTVKYIIPWTSVVLYTETEQYIDDIEGIDLRYEGIFYGIDD